MTCRARAVTGFTLVEAVTALLLGGLMLSLVLGTLARQRTVQERLARRAEVMEALRTTRHVLGEELRWTEPGAASTGPDSVALRGYRGTALICPGGTDRRSVVVGFRGIRAPDPAKDSVELLDAGGTATAVALLDRTPGVPSCGTNGDLAPERWLLSAAAPADAVVARIFERGSYHLSGGALRYRRGGSGRQPLTPGVVDTPPSLFEPSGLRFLGVRIYAGGARRAGDSLRLALPWAP